MKNKILWLVILTICLAFSVSAQKKSSSDSVEKTLSENEKAVWGYLVNKQYDKFAAMLADDYQGIYDIETTTKVSEVSEVKQITFKSPNFTSINVKMLDANTALVTSEMSVEMTAPDGQEVGGTFRTTTIWVKRGGKWLIVYHSHVAKKL